MMWSSKTLIALLASTSCAAFTTFTSTSTVTVFASTSTSTSTILADPSTSTSTISCTLTPTIITVVTYTASDTATTTITTISTPTITTLATVAPLCSTPATCGNTGLQYAYRRAVYASTCGSNKDSVYCNSIEPADYKSTAYGFNGTVPEVGGFIAGKNGPDASVYIPLYNHSVPANYILLNHRGYFYAPQTGAYQFKFGLCDDKGWVWLGYKAYSGWNASNANDYVVYTNLATGTFNATLTAGSYNPFRLFYAQGFGPANLTYSVVGPDGTILAATADGGSPYWIQYSCDNVAAPAFPLYGQET